MTWQNIQINHLLKKPHAYLSANHIAIFEQTQNNWNTQIIYTQLFFLYIYNMLKLVFRVQLLIIFVSTPLINKIQAQCIAGANAGADQFICNPIGQITLNGSVSNASCFEWSPITGLSDPTSLNPQVTVSGNATYTLSAFAPDYTNNLVTNGDFELGNSSFTSDYTYNPTSFALYALYTIIISPSLISSNLPPCTDHTSGTGNLLLVRGDSNIGGSFWCQNVAVNPNTNYLFSYWISTVVPIDPATVQLSVNNQLITPSFTASNTSCNWELVEVKWNSGSKLGISGSQMEFG